MERMIDELKAVPLAVGHDEVFYPGEIEARNEARNRRDGWCCRRIRSAISRRSPPSAGWRRLRHPDRADLTGEAELAAAGRPVSLSIALEDHVLGEFGRPSSSRARACASATVSVRPSRSRT